VNSSQVSAGRSTPQNNPTVSVILPTYNRAAALPRAVDSVLAQTYEDFELLIVDDGSTDQTREIVQGFIDHRIVCIESRQNLGAGAARNLGIRQAGGRYIAFQDSDDEWRREKLARQVDTIERASPHSGVVYTNYLRARVNRTIVGLSRLRRLASRARLPHTRLEGNLLHALARGNFITTQAALVRRDYLESAGGFDERLPRLQDWDLWLRLAHRCQFVFIDEPLVTLYETPGSLSSQPESLLPAFQRILDKHTQPATLYQELLAGYHFAQADFFLHSGAPSQGREQLARALRLSPDNATYWFAALAACLGTKVYRRWMRAASLGYFH
jgi:glycosyltransferase involved in cell wall biosynthesis